MKQGPFTSKNHFNTPSYAFIILLSDYLLSLFSAKAPNFPPSAPYIPCTLAVHRLSPH